MSETKVKLDKRKAVAIAKDVLLQISKFKQVGGVGYLNIICPIPEKGSVQKSLPKLIPKCGVCALGSMFISYINKYNRIKFEDYLDKNETENINDVSSEAIMKILKDCFTREELLLVEKSFERWLGGQCYYDYLQGIYVYQTIIFHDKYKNSRSRLRAIMKNIIKNKGRFVLPDLKPNNGESIRAS